MERLHWQITPLPETGRSFFDSPDCVDNGKVLDYLTKAYYYSTKEYFYSGKKAEVEGKIRVIEYWLRRNSLLRRSILTLLFFVLAAASLFCIICIYKKSQAPINVYLIAACAALCTFSVLFLVHFLRLIVALVGRNPKKKQADHLYQEYLVIHNNFQRMIDLDPKTREAAAYFLWLFPQMTATSNDIAFLYDLIRSGRAACFVDALQQLDAYERGYYMNDQIRWEREYGRSVALAAGRGYAVSGQ